MSLRKVQGPSVVPKDNVVKETMCEERKVLFEVEGFRTIIISQKSAKIDGKLRDGIEQIYIHEGTGLGGTFGALRIWNSSDRVETCPLGGSRVLIAQNQV